MVTVTPVCAHSMGGSRKKLDLFLSLDGIRKAGFMSKYLMKCARRWGIPQTYIKSYSKKIESWKNGKKWYKDEPDKLGDRNFDLVNENICLCNAVFEVYDICWSKLYIVVIAIRYWSDVK